MKIASKLKRLNQKLDKARGKYDSALGALHAELEDLSGLELESNDFPGDGLGIGIRDCHTYMPFDDLLKVIEEKGTFSEDDLITTL